MDNRNSKLDMVRGRMGVQHLEPGMEGMVATGGRRGVVTRRSAKGVYDSGGLISSADLSTPQFFFFAYICEFSFIYTARLMG